MISERNWPMAAFEAVNGQAQSESTLVRKVSWDASSSMRLLSCWLKITPYSARICASKLGSSRYSSKTKNYAS